MLAMLVGSTSAAFASAGCDVVNASGFNVNRGGTGVSGKIVSGFAAGDKLSITVIGGATVNDDWFLLIPSPATTLFEIEGPVNTPQTVSYTVTGNRDTTLESNISLTNSFASMTATATCVAAPPNSPGGSSSNQNLDSQLLRELQIDLTKTVANQFRRGNHRRHRWRHQRCFLRERRISDQRRRERSAAQSRGRAAVGRGTPSR